MSKRIYSNYTKLIILLSITLTSLFSFGQNKFLEQLETLSIQNNLKLMSEKVDSALFIKTNTSKDKLKLLYYKGLIYNEIGNSKEALRLAYTLLNVANKSSQIETYFDAYNLFGNVYFSLNDHKKSLKYYKKIEALFKKKNIPKSKRYYNNQQNLGSFYMSLLPNQSFSDFDTAYVYLNNAIQYYKKTFPNEVAETYINMGSLFSSKYSYTKNLDDARLSDSYYLKAIESCKKNNNSKSLGKALVNRASLAYKKNDLNASKTIFLESIPYLQKNRDFASLIFAYDYLRYINELQQNWKEAYDSREYFVSYSDTLKVIDNKRLADQLEVKHQTEQKKLEIDLLKKQRQNQDKNLNNFRKIQYAGGILLLFVVLLLFFQLKKTKEISQDKKALEVQLNNEKNKLEYEWTKHKTAHSIYLQKLNHPFHSTETTKSFYLGHYARRATSSTLFWKFETKAYHYFIQAIQTPDGYKAQLLEQFGTSVWLEAITEEHSPSDLIQTFEQKYTQYYNIGQVTTPTSYSFIVVAVSTSTKQVEVFNTSEHSLLYIAQVWDFNLNTINLLGDSAYEIQEITAGTEPSIREAKKGDFIVLSSKNLIQEKRKTIESIFSTTEKLRYADLKQAFIEQIHETCVQNDTPYELGIIHIV